MKTEAEIQKAHDILVEIILNRVPNPFPPKTRELLMARMDVLCWALDHDHNKSFEENLEKIQKFLAQLGYSLNTAAAPFTEATHPMGPTKPEP
jgi:hypothetical protein